MLIFSRCRKVILVKIFDLGVSNGLRHSGTDHEPLILSPYAFLALSNHPLWIMGFTLDIIVI